MPKDDTYWNSPIGLREQAAEHLHANHAPGDPGFCPPNDATWTLEVLSPVQLTDAFADPQSARDWLANEAALDEDEELHRDWRQLLAEDIRDPVVVLIRDGQTHVWDGWHRIAACIATQRPVRAIVGRPHEYPAIRT